MLAPYTMYFSGTWGTPTSCSSHACTVHLVFFRYLGYPHVMLITCLHRTPCIFQVPGVPPHHAHHMLAPYTMYFSGTWGTSTSCSSHACTLLSYWKLFHPHCTHIISTKEHKFPKGSFSNLRQTWVVPFMISIWRSMQLRVD